MSNLGLNILLGGYYGSAIMGRQYVGSGSGAQQARPADEIAPVESAPIGAPDEEREIGPKPVNQSVEDRFEKRLENRFRQADPSEQAAVSAKAEKLKAAALEIGGALGHAKAHEFMSPVLSAATSSDNADKSAAEAELAAESFINALSDAAKDDPATYQKLEEVKKTLNKAAGQIPGQEEDEDEEGGTAAGGLKAADAAEAEAQQAAAGPKTAGRLQGAQERLYQSYVQAKSQLAASSNAFLAQKVGNLVNAFI
jgi:hypothetical protein